MKILSCHIENFGVLQDKDYDFSGGLTQFCEENGAGKTTLAAFIRAMFYGLHATRANSKIFDGRRRYYPFNGGKFGGNLTFSRGGDEYRIERFFDIKSDTRDRLAVYKNGAQIKIENVGEWAFGLDEAAFARTLFVTADDIDGGAEGLGERICGKMFTGEGVGLDEALSALDERRKSLKLRGGGGAIDRKKAEIAQLKDDIAGLETIDAGLGALYADRKALLDKIAALEVENEKLNEDRLTAERWAVYDGYIADGEKKRREMEEAKAAFPNGAPTEEEIKFCAAKLKKYNDNAAEIKSRAPSELKEERLKFLKEKFALGAPTEEDFAAVEGLTSAISLNEAELERLNAGEGERVGKLADTFRKGLPDEKTLSELDGAYKRYSSAAAAAPAGGKTKLSPAVSGLAIFAGIALISGIFLCLLSLIAGIATIVGGVLLLAAAAFLYLRNRTRAALPDGQTRSGDEVALRSVLAQYGYYSDSVLVDYTRFLSDCGEYKRILEARAEREEKIDALSGQISEDKAAVSDFLSRFGEEEGSARSAIFALRAEVKELENGLREGELSAADCAALSEENTRIYAEVSAVLQKYGIPFSEDLTEVFDGAKRVADLSREAENLAARAEGYKIANDLNERGAGEVDLTAVRDELQKLRQDLGLSESRISECEADLERLPEKRNRLEEAGRELKNLEASLRIVQAAAENLKIAHERTCDKYVAPVSGAFRKYADAIEASFGERVKFGADFEVNFEFGGEIKSRKHLSAGQLAVCGLSVRLAIIENIFKGEKPIAILDDPFVNLDGANFARTAKVVEKLSEDMQIIYFCCHDARRIK